MFSKLLTDAIQEQKNDAIQRKTYKPTKTIEETILQSIKKWWNTTRKTYDDIDILLNDKTTIDGYTFRVASGPQANIFARKNNESIHILHAGQPDTPTEFKEEIIRQLVLYTGEHYKMVEIYDPLKSSTPVCTNRIDTSMKIDPPNCFQR